MQFDYLIVGGGSAGCVLANRLSAGKRSVCLVEAGPADTHPLIRVPLATIPLLRNRQLNWNYWTANQPNCGNRRIYWPRGRTLGGSSVLNVMCHVRGQPGDYDRWAALGNRGWSYAELLPTFRTLECFEPGWSRPAAFDQQFHGFDGPLHAAESRDVHPLARVFVEAGLQAGHPRNEDFNGAFQQGVGLYSMTQKNGRRCSNAHAYLPPEVRNRRQLKILTETRVTRLLFDGSRAIGARCLENGRYRDIQARFGVLLAAGAIGSPHLLQLSGVGPPALLEKHGIETRHALPGVGENLQDHVDTPITVIERTDLAMRVNIASLPRWTAAAARYLLQRRGPLSSSLVQAGGFFRSDADAVSPNLQWHFMPFIMARHGEGLAPLRRFSAYTLRTALLRPRSRGRIGLRSGDPLEKPLIDPNYFADPADLDDLVAGLKISRELLAQPAFDPHRLRELRPGPAIDDDRGLADFIRENCETLYHPVGTCKMGGDALAVVDHRLRVHGLQGLRVADASIMPEIVSGNTNTPVTLIAEKAAAMQLEDDA